MVRRCVRIIISGCPIPLGGRHTQILSVWGSLYWCYWGWRQLVINVTYGYAFGPYLALAKYPAHEDTRERRSLIKARGVRMVVCARRSRRCAVGLVGYTSFVTTWTNLACYPAVVSIGGGPGANSPTDFERSFVRLALQYGCISVQRHFRTALLSSVIGRVEDDLIHFEQSTFVFFFRAKIYPSIFSALERDISAILLGKKSRINSATLL